MNLDSNNLVRDMIHTNEETNELNNSEIIEISQSELPLEFKEIKEISIGHIKIANDYAQKAKTSANNSLNLSNDAEYHASMSNKFSEKAKKCAEKVNKFSEKARSYSEKSKFHSEKAKTQAEEAQNYAKSSYSNALISQIHSNLLDSDLLQSNEDTFINFMNRSPEERCQISLENMNHSKKMIEYLDTDYEKYLENLPISLKYSAIMMGLSSITVEVNEKMYMNYLKKGFYIVEKKEKYKLNYIVDIKTLNL